MNTTLQISKGAAQRLQEALKIADADATAREVTRQLDKPRVAIPSAAVVQQKVEAVKEERAKAMSKLWVLGRAGERHSTMANQLLGLMQSCPEFSARRAAAELMVDIESDIRQQLETLRSLVEHFQMPHAMIEGELHVEMGIRPILCKGTVCRFPWVSN